MLSVLQGRALEEKDTGLHSVDRPLGQQHFLEELSILLEVEEEADQVGLSRWQAKCLLGLLSDKSSQKVRRWPNKARRPASQSVRPLAQTTCPAHK